VAGVAAALGVLGAAAVTVAAVADGAEAFEGPLAAALLPFSDCCFCFLAAAEEEGWRIMCGCFDVLLVGRGLGVTGRAGGLSTDKSSGSL